MNGYVTKGELLAEALRLAKLAGSAETIAMAEARYRGVEAYAAIARAMNPTEKFIGSI